MKIIKTTIIYIKLQENLPIQPIEEVASIKPLKCTFFCEKCVLSLNKL